VRLSVLDAIKSGDWNYEPEETDAKEGFDSTSALPGSDQKLEVLAKRIQNGLPLWHPKDRLHHGSADPSDV
jgi:hypothetical protein